MIILQRIKQKKTRLLYGDKLCVIAWNHAMSVAFSALRQKTYPLYLAVEEKVISHDPSEITLTEPNLYPPEDTWSNGPIITTTRELEYPPDMKKTSPSLVH